MDLAAVDRTGDVMIEVIDLGTPQVIARQRFDAITLRLLEGSDLLYSARQDGMRYVTMDLWRARSAPRP